MHASCPDCDATTIVECPAESHPFEYGASPNTIVLHAVHPVFKCESCGYMWADYRAEDARDDAVAVHLAGH